MSAESITDDIPDLTVHDGDVFLVGARCLDCDSVMFPERSHCIDCLGETTPIEFDRRANLESYTEIHVGPPSFDLPYTAGFVSLSPGDVRTFTYLAGDAGEFTVDAPVIVDDGTVGDRHDWVFRPVDHD